jgi:hypothetical protein
MWGYDRAASAYRSSSNWKALERQPEVPEGLRDNSAGGNRAGARNQ